MKGFCVGNRIECSLTGLVGREGLWTALYPGTVIEVLEEDGSSYVVALDNYLPRLRVTQDRLFHQRNIADRCTVPPKEGTLVHVLEYDNEIPVWWEATVAYSLGGYQYVKVNWRHQWKNHAPSQWVSWRSIRLAVPVEEEEQLCKDCGKHPLFNKHSVCGACYVADKVDGIMDVLEARIKLVPFDKKHQWKWNRLLLTRALVAQGGGGKRRQKRLQKQLIHLSTWLDEVLPEHWDEQEWEMRE
jgi:hypothetical protein